MNFNLSFSLIFIFAFELVFSVPFPQDGTPTHLLKVEHKNDFVASRPIIQSSNTTRPNPLSEVVDSVLNSQTVNAVDVLTSRVVALFGSFVEDIGDFVVKRVQELPDAIDRVAQRLDTTLDRAQLANVEETVRNDVEIFQNDVNQLQNAFKRTEDTIRRSQEQLGVAYGRILGVLYRNMDDIDKAVAQGIRRVTGIEQAGQTPVISRSVEKVKDDTQKQ